MSHHGVFYTDSFFDLSFDFDCTLAGQGDFRRILQVAALAFLRAIYVCKIIAYHTTIWITAAASGNACKSVWNPYASKGKVKKRIRGQRLRAHPINPWALFWPSSCSRRLTGRIMAWLIYIHILIICIIRSWRGNGLTSWWGNGFGGEAWGSTFMDSDRSTGVIL